MSIPENMPDPLRRLLQRMVAISFSDRPSVRDAYLELIRLHDLLLKEGHTAMFLRTVWGVPTQLTPGRSSEVCSDARCKTGYWWQPLMAARFTLPQMILTCQPSQLALIECHKLTMQISISAEPSGAFGDSEQYMNKFMC